jgi:hypothetical protein
MSFMFVGLLIRLLLFSRNFLRIHHAEILIRQKLPYLKNEQENIEA